VFGVLLDLEVSAARKEVKKKKKKKRRENNELFKKVRYLYSPDRPCLFFFSTLSIDPSHLFFQNGIKNYNFCYLLFPFNFEDHFQ